jgi:hypothetical protein
MEEVNPSIPIRFMGRVITGHQGIPSPDNLLSLRVGIFRLPL